MRLKLNLRYDDGGRRKLMSCDGGRLKLNLRSGDGGRLKLNLRSDDGGGGS